MNIINKPDIYFQKWEEFDEDGMSFRSGTYRYVLVHSSVINLNELDDFLAYHWEYDTSYHFYMNIDTFKSYCNQYNVEIDCDIPDNFQCHGLEMFIVPYLKDDEILTIPQHDYEHHELQLIG